MKPFVKFTWFGLLFVFSAASMAFAVELDDARRNTENTVVKLQIRGFAERDANISETGKTGGLFTLTLPEYLNKDKLLETGGKLKDYLPPKEILAESLGLTGAEAEGEKGVSSVSITDYIDKEKLLETAGKLKEAMPSKDELKDATGLSDVSAFIDDTKNAAQTQIDALQTEANNLISADAWNERLDRYATDVKESEVVTGVKGKFDEIKEPIKDIVQNPQDTVVGRTVKSAAEYPKRLLIKIVIIVVIILVIVGIIKVIIAKITALRNKMAVKAVKYVVGKGVQHVNQKRQAGSAAETAGTPSSEDMQNADSVVNATSAPAAAAKPEELGEQALKYVLGLGVEQLNKKFNLNVQVAGKQTKTDVDAETGPADEVFVSETVATEVKEVVIEQAVTEMTDEAVAKSANANVRKTPTRMLRKQKSRPGKVCP